MITLIRLTAPGGMPEYFNVDAIAHVGVDTDGGGSAIIAMGVRLTVRESVETVIQLIQQSGGK